MTFSALILFAHGSRDPAWHRPMLAVAQRVEQASPATWVRCAYLELTEPDLAHAVQQAVSAGHTHIRVVPMFLGVGKHAREDLPVLAAQLRTAHPLVTLDITPAVGENNLLLDTLARVALAA